MATEINPENGDENGKDSGSEMDYEIIDANEVNFVKRGRKANIDGKLLEVMTKLKKNQAIALNKFSVNGIADAKAKKTAQAKHSATIRAHAKRAGWEKASIGWQENGIPVVQRTA